MTTRRKSSEGSAMSELASKIDLLTEGMQNVLSWQSENGVHIKDIIGPPHLRDKIKEYVDDRDDHKQRGILETIQNIQKLTEIGVENVKLQLDSQIKDVRHAVEMATKEIAYAKLIAENTEKTRAQNDKDNGERLRRLEVRLAGYIGIALGSAWMFEHFILRVKS